MSKVFVCNSIAVSFMAFLWVILFGVLFWCLGSLCIALFLVSVWPFSCFVLFVVFVFRIFVCSHVAVGYVTFF